MFFSTKRHAFRCDHTAPFNRTYKQDFRITRLGTRFINMLLFAFLLVWFLGKVLFFFRIIYISEMELFWSYKQTWNVDNSQENRNPKVEQTNQATCQWHMVYLAMQSNSTWCVWQKDGMCWCQNMYYFVLKIVMNVEIISKATGNNSK